MRVHKLSYLRPSEEDVVDETTVHVTAHVVAHTEVDISQLSSLESSGKSSHQLLDGFHKLSIIDFSNSSISSLDLV